MAQWLHKTKTGRVVYDEKPSAFKGKDVLRILRSLWFKGWRWVETDFRSLVFEILGLAVRAAAENGLRVMIWLSDLFRQLLQAAWNLVSFENADDAYVLAETLKELSEEWTELAEGWGGGPQVATLPSPWWKPPTSG